MSKRAGWGLSLVMGFLFCGGGVSAQTMYLVPDDIATIQEAIDAAVDGDTVTVRRSDTPYAEDFTLKTGVIVQGEETLETVLSGTVSTTLGAGGTLQRFTLQTPAYKFTRAADLVIRNCVVIGATERAIEVENSTGTRIVNNVFYDNGTALWFSNVDSFTASSGEITANAFVANGTAMTAPMPAVTKAFNLFQGNTTDGITGTVLTGDPLFVDEAGEDFHLQTGSPCIDAVTDGSLSDPDDTEADCGAYGGPELDPLPAQVGEVTATAGTAQDSVDVTWSASADYLVTGYNLYYGTTSGDIIVNGAADSPIAVPGRATAARSLTGLPAAVDPPPAPTNLTAGPGDRQIDLAWTAEPTATGYTVLYGTESGIYTEEVDAGDVTAFSLAGLTNDLPYFIAVRSYAATDYFFALSAVGTEPVDPPVAPEGRLSEEVTVAIGKTAGGQSDEVSETPERVAGFPDLEDSGFCFITGLDPGGTGSKDWESWLAALALLALGAMLAVRHQTRRVCGFAILALCCLAFAGTARAEEARWTLDVRAGAFLPSDGDWDQHYDQDTVLDLKAGAGYRLVPWLEFGADAGFRRAEGKARTTVSGRPLTLPRDQTLTVYPLQAYVQLNLQASQQQLLVPYLAAGPTRYLYRHEVKDSGTAEGHQDGFHVRGGVRLSLNRFDTYGAARARSQFGLLSSGLTLEAQYSQVDDFGSADTDLGGWSLFGGLNLQF